MKPSSTKTFASLTAFTIALLSGCSESPKEQTETKPPNIIFVYADNLGYGDIELFGATTIKTPSLNRMAAEGRRFTHLCDVRSLHTFPLLSYDRFLCPAGRHALERSRRPCAQAYFSLRPKSERNHSRRNPEEARLCDHLHWQMAFGRPVGVPPTRQGFDSYYGIPYSDDMVARTLSVDGSVWPPLPLMEDETVVEAPADRDTLTSVTPNGPSALSKTIGTNPSSIHAAGYAGLDSSSLRVRGVQREIRSRSVGIPSRSSIGPSARFLTS